MKRMSVVSRLSAGLLLSTSASAQALKNLEHHIAAIEEGKFHGWPANNGAWQWADMGYPRLARRTDGKLVAMYYWASSEHPQQHIAATIWQPWPN